MREPAWHPPFGTFVTAAGVEWRWLHEGLWVGRRNGYPVGQIERRHRYVAMHADIGHCGGHASFARAEAALLRGTAWPERVGTPLWLTISEVAAALVVVGLGYCWALAMLQS